MARCVPEVRLRSAGLKATAPRRALFNVLERARKPLSIAGVLSALARMPDDPIDTVTAYRTLRAFEQAGLARRVDLGHRHAHYELVEEHRDTHHVICIVCGRTEPFNGCDARHLAQEALSQVRGFRKVTGHSLALFGTCNACVTKHS